MATSRAVSSQIKSAFDADRHNGLGLVLSGALPLSVFIIVHGMADLAGVVPLFFAPFGLPGWMGAVLHIGTLPLLGIARWMVVAHQSRAGRNAGWWLVGLMAGMIALPFIVAPLDSLMLSVVSMSLLVMSVATSLRVAKVSVHAALVMLPGVLWLGLSALVGLTLVAAWAPPFGLTNAQGQI